MIKHKHSRLAGKGFDVVIRQNPGEYEGNRA